MSTQSAYGFTGEMQSGDLVYLRARYLNVNDGRFLSRDTWEGDYSSPLSLNRWMYVEGNPVNRVDPTGQTVRSALDLIRSNRTIIKSTAEQNHLEPILLAGVVFSENRNDYNFVPGWDWTSIFSCGIAGGPEIKNHIGKILKNNVSLGITEISISVGYMIDHPDKIPDNYGSMSWDERTVWQNDLADEISSDERSNVITRLEDPKLSLEYAAKYLSLLAKYRDYGDNYALWLSDYNRGLSDWDSTSEYGRRIDVYLENIEHVLYWQESEMPLCVGTVGCAYFYDVYLYGILP